MNRIALLVSLLAVLLLPTSALAAKAAPPPTPAPTPDSTADEMTTEIVHIKHIEPSAAAEVLRGLASRRGRVEHNRELGVVTIYDKPALVAKMLEVVADLDKPRVTLSFEIVLVAAGSEAAGTGRALGEDMDKVLAELRKLFAYPHYSLKDRARIQMLAGSRAELQVAGQSGYKIELESTGQPGADSRLPVRIEVQRTWMQGSEMFHDSVVATSIEVSDGETTVVGASRLNGDDNALVVILKTTVEK